MKRYPIVHIHSIDHCASQGGEYEAADVIPVDAVGFLHRETKEAYFLVPMVFGYNISDEHNVTICIVKAPGTIKKVVGYGVNSSKIRSHE